MQYIYIDSKQESLKRIQVRESAEAAISDSSLGMSENRNIGAPVKV